MEAPQRFGQSLSSTTEGDRNRPEAASLQWAALSCHVRSSPDVLSCPVLFCLFCQVCWSGHVSSRRVVSCLAWPLLAVLVLTCLALSCCVPSGPVAGNHHSLDRLEQVAGNWNFQALSLPQETLVRKALKVNHWECFVAICQSLQYPLFYQGCR